LSEFLKGIIPANQIFQGGERLIFCNTPILQGEETHVSLEINNLF
jgi:hypothetical protein